jgi:hypothetical protein
VPENAGVIRATLASRIAPGRLPIIIGHSVLTCRAAVIIILRATLRTIAAISTLLILASALCLVAANLLSARSTARV